MDLVTPGGTGLWQVGAFLCSRAHPLPWLKKSLTSCWFSVQ